MAVGNRVGELSFKAIMRWGPAIQQRLYPVATKLFAKSGELLLLNNGYEEDPPMGLPLDPEDESSRYQIQLYHVTANQVDLKGKRVLEVGCGHGGGASYIMRKLGPKSYTGLDLNPSGIEYCRERLNIPNLHFVQGHAEQLPFPDESFDAVINIESSHCYPNFRGFLAEVVRVLTPGGHFLYSDSQPPIGIEAWEAALADAPWKMISQRVISDDVARGFHKNAFHLQDVVDSRTPPFLRSMVRKRLHEGIESNCSALESGALSYRLYCFEKE